MPGKNEPHHDVLKRKAVKEKMKNFHRKCLRCGRNSYPNYFYCPYCHTQLNDPEEDRYVVRFPYKRNPSL